MTGGTPHNHIISVMPAAIAVVVILKTIISVVMKDVVIEHELRSDSH